MIGFVVNNLIHQQILPLDGRSVPSRDLIGGKAHSIAQMQHLGLAVPPAFVITAEACRFYQSSGCKMSPGLNDAIRDGIGQLERASKRTFARGDRPLLVSVRSGAAVSMPGMMDTVLDLGVNDVTERSLADELGSSDLARDIHWRFWDMFARIVLRLSLTLDRTLSPSQWRIQAGEAWGKAVPEAPHEQLEFAVRAVFDSWSGLRARRYRQHHGIPDDLGTAVVVQAMVFGNAGSQSGTGVLFTRNPLTGEALPYGEFLPNAQGEDIVSGTRTPGRLDLLKEMSPDVHRQLLQGAAKLELQNRDVQDIEFTVERGRLYFLQARSAKRSAAAAIRSAVEMVQEGLITTSEAIGRVTAEQVRRLLQPRIAENASAMAQILARGEPACPGAGAGLMVADPDTAQREAQQGTAVVLGRPTTSPEDIGGMIAAAAVVTEQGGSTSHAAVVSRALGVPCVVGCGEGSLENLYGETVTVDGSRGLVYAGSLAVEHPSEDDFPSLQHLSRWAADESPIQVLKIGDSLPHAAIDLDASPAVADPEQFYQLLAGAKGARGRIFATSDEAVAAAVRAGLKFIVSPQVLPALLSACTTRKTR